MAHAAWRGVLILSCSALIINRMACVCQICLRVCLFAPCVPYRSLSALISSFLSFLSFSALVASSAPQPFCSFLAVWSLDDLFRFPTAIVCVRRWRDWSQPRPPTAHLKLASPRPCGAGSGGAASRCSNCLVLRSARYALGVFVCAVTQNFTAEISQVGKFNWANFMTEWEEKKRRKQRSDYKLTRCELKLAFLVCVCVSACVCVYVCVCKCSLQSLKIQG